MDELCPSPALCFGFLFKLAAMFCREGRLSLCGRHSAIPEGAGSIPGKMGIIAQSGYTTGSLTSVF